MASGSGGAGSQSSVGDSEGRAVDPRYPLWAYVEKLGGASSGSGSRGGNAKFRCKFCNKVYPGSYTRVRPHLLQITKKDVGTCDKIPHSSFEQICKEDRAAAQLLEHGATRHTIPLPPYDASAPTRKRKQTAIAESFNAEVRQQADAHLARMFYTAGLPFNLARNPNFRAAITFIANNSLGGYVPPGYNSLRTTLLDQEKKHIQRSLEPIKSTWPYKGVSIATDGWSDPQRRPILNFMAVTEGGPMFLKAIDTEGEEKKKEYIFEKLQEVIEEVGVDCVVQVVTDNAANCKAAGLMIEAKYKNIFWTPCIVHTLNLALKNICDPKNNEGDNFYLWFIKKASDDASFIKNFIMNHSMRLSMFNEFSKLKFLQIAETRFASVVIMFKRFLLLKDALVQMVVHPNWAAYREDDVAKSQRVKDHVLNDVWWDNIAYIVSFTEPIYAMIRLADTDKPCLHLIYEMWDSMIEKERSMGKCVSCMKLLKRSLLLVGPRAIPPCIVWLTH
ncbi:hypothetical protein ACQ4PT_003028 [Festuca glaucescens]